MNVLLLVLGIILDAHSADKMDLEANAPGASAASPGRLKSRVCASTAVDCSLDNAYIKSR